MSKSMTMLIRKSPYVVRVSTAKTGAILSKVFLLLLYFSSAVLIYWLYSLSMSTSYNVFDAKKSLNEYFYRIDEKKPYIIDSLSLECNDLKTSPKNSTIIQKYRSWKFDYRPYLKTILESSEKCKTIHELFAFSTVPKSLEEKNYPLAYGIIAYFNFIQFLFMLSSIYEPQNHYCVAVSGSATKEFKMLMQNTSECFHNVHIQMRPPISWGSFEIINSTFSCMEFLTKHTQYEYFQYLSGVDAPLKTNIEMVRIFKQLNESANVEFLKFPKSRLKGKHMQDDSIEVLKSSLSALIPRKSAEYMVQSNSTRAFLKFLKGTAIPDESFWGTILGNADVLPVPGAINGSKLLLERAKIRRPRSNRQSKTYLTNYLSRYQVWGKNSYCKGKLSSGSCVYGVGDVAHLLTRPHLVAHKFYMNYEPAAFFCVLKAIRYRSIERKTAFSEFAYDQIPFVELKAGTAYENLSHKLWLSD